MITFNGRYARLVISSLLLLDNEQVYIIIVCVCLYIYTLDIIKYIDTCTHKLVTFVLG